MTPAQTDLDSANPRESGWRDRNWLIFAELAVVAAIFLADQHHLIFFSKTPYLLLLAWISLRVRKVSWRQVGFALYRGWTTTLLLGISLGVGLELFDLFGKQRLLSLLMGKPPDLSVFRAVKGNAKLALLMLLLVWTLAAFGEELVYRGYLMNHVAELLGSKRGAWAVSLILISALFGLAHAGQGITGVLEEGSDGLILGLMYLAFGRSLAVPIVAHGVCDTIDTLLLFLGKYPG
jgi:uncharacterized protein